MSTRKWLREMLAQARSVGIRDAMLEHGGKHPKIVGTVGGKSIRCVLAGSPSDSRRGSANVRAFLRRSATRG